MHMETQSEILLTSIINVFTEECQQTEFLLLFRDYQFSHTRQPNITEVLNLELESLNTQFL